jgi:hypothetical protein
VTRKTWDAVYLCGGVEPQRRQPCEAGGPDHTPFPNGYDAHQQYAAQLLSTGWTQSRCPACELFKLWTHPTLTDLPEPTENPDAENGVWEIPDGDDRDLDNEAFEGWGPGR